LARVFLDVEGGKWLSVTERRDLESRPFSCGRVTLTRGDSLVKTKRALIMHPKDNVATSVEEVDTGEQVSAEIGGEWRTVVAREVIPFGFKIALTDIPKGNTIVKYGELIGKSSREINGGDLVHIHNVEGTRGRGDLVKGGK
jgi:altronate dehydratase small subunit